MKRKFRDSLRSKTDVTGVNVNLCGVLLVYSLVAPDSRDVYELVTGYRGNSIARRCWFRIRVTASTHRRWNASPQQVDAS